jgi:hypothetical protein
MFGHYGEGDAGVIEVKLDLQVGRAAGFIRGG